MADITGYVRSNANVLMRDFDTITNNLANANTPGFKRRANAFSAALQAQTTRWRDAADTAGRIQLHESLDFSQGTLVQTGRSLDLALQGSGFFTIETTAGPRYTRNGTFQTNQNGQLVDSDNHLVAGQAGPIVIPPTVDTATLNVSSDGRVSSGDLILGQFRLADFGDRQDQLIPAGGSLLLAPEGVTPQTAQNCTVQQGYQESSNVNVMEELVGMVTVSRLYDANMKFISARKEASQSLMDVAMG